MNVLHAPHLLLSLPLVLFQIGTDNTSSVLFSLGTGIFQPSSGKWHCLDKIITYVFSPQRRAVGARHSFSAGKHCHSLKADLFKDILMFL